MSRNLNSPTDKKIHFGTLVEQVVASVFQLAITTTTTKTTTETTAEVRTERIHVKR